MKTLTRPSELLFVEDVALQKTPFNLYYICTLFIIYYTLCKCYIKFFFRYFTKKHRYLSVKDTVIINII